MTICPAWTTTCCAAGKPTTHVQFDEATAVLAGDGLLTFAFEILADPATHASPAVRCQLIAGLARAAGSEGMVGGQMMDMLAPDKSFDSQAVMELQRLKTGALFEFACEAGPILGEAGGEARETLRAYARDFGLTFQITDDLIDTVSSAGAAGKSVGKDEAQGKATLVSIFGVEGRGRRRLSSPSARPRVWTISGRRPICCGRCPTVSWIGTASQVPKPPGATLRPEP